jgi:hypothetical protein
MRRAACNYSSKLVKARHLQPSTSQACLYWCGRIGMDDSGFDLRLGGHCEPCQRLAESFGAQTQILSVFQSLLNAIQECLFGTAVNRTAYSV